jgi:hypothetical protein
MMSMPNGEVGTKATDRNLSTEQAELICSHCMLSEILVFPAPLWSENLKNRKIQKIPNIHAEPGIRCYMGFMMLHCPPRCASIPHQPTGMIWKEFLVPALIQYQLRFGWAYLWPLMLDPYHQHMCQQRPYGQPGDTNMAKGQGYMEVT